MGFLKWLLSQYKQYKIEKTFCSVTDKASKEKKFMNLFSQCREYDSGGDPYNIHCDCGLEFCTGTYDIEEFAKAWNTRKPMENNIISMNVAISD